MLRRKRCCGCLKNIYIAQILSDCLDREREYNEVVREDLFNNSDLFNETFSQACQQRSVPPSLLTLVKNQCKVSKVFSPVVRHLKFNSIKHGRKSTDGSVLRRRMITITIIITITTNISKIPTARRQTSWSFTIVAEELSSGPPRTTQASGQNGKLGNPIPLFSGVDTR